MTAGGCVVPANPTPPPPASDSSIRLHSALITTEATLARAREDMTTANDTVHADVLVIGFGKGGKAVAAKMGRLGKRVVVVERSARMYGGTCPNVGCVPTKGLVHRSHRRRAEERAQEWYEQSVQEVQTIRDMMRRGNFDALDSIDTVTVITGRATFLDPHSVRVVTADEKLTVTADTVLIDTGSEPVIPEIPGTMSGAGRSSPISPWTTAGSCSTNSPARHGARRPTGWWCPAPCS
jgi:hypothetical protein